MMDEVLTRKIQTWLDAPREQRDIPAGAELLLRLNRNRYMHRRILTCPERMHDKLEYELRKHLRIRLDGLTVTDVKKMERSVLPAVKVTLTENIPVPEGEDDEQPTRFIGKRKDHDSLPEHIRELYDRNGVLYFKMKQLYNQLLAMEEAPACDRYEYLKQLEEADRQYHAAWARYDAYRPGTEPEPKAEETTAVAANRISAARKFISQNKAKLEDAQPGSEVHAALLDAMQDKISLILQGGGSFKPAYQTELEHLGLMFDVV